MDQNPRVPADPIPTIPTRRPIWRRLAYPSTWTGWWSIGLVVIFFIFLKLVFFWAAQPGHDRRTFFSDPVAAFTLLGTATSGIAAGVMAVIAMVKRERSIVVFLAFLLGLFVLYFTLGELVGH